MSDRGSGVGELDGRTRIQFSGAVSLFPRPSVLRRETCPRRSAKAPSPSLQNAQPGLDPRLETEGYLRVSSWIFLTLGTLMKTLRKAVQNHRTGIYALVVSALFFALLTAPLIGFASTNAATESDKESASTHYLRTDALSSLREMLHPLSGSQPVRIETLISLDVAISPMLQSYLRRHGGGDSASYANVAGLRTLLDELEAAASLDSTGQSDKLTVCEFHKSPLGKELGTTDKPAVLSYNMYYVEALVRASLVQNLEYDKTPDAAQQWRDSESHREKVEAEIDRLGSLPILADPCSPEAVEDLKPRDST